MDERAHHGREWAQSPDTAVTPDPTAHCPQPFNGTSCSALSRAYLYLHLHLAVSISRSLLALFGSAPMPSIVPGKE